MTDFSGDFISMSNRISQVSASLVLAVQCLVFVVGVFNLAATVSRSAFFLMAHIDSSPVSISRGFAFVYDSSRSSVQTRYVMSATTENVQRLSEQHTRYYESSTSDIVSLSALRLFSETKV